MMSTRASTVLVVEDDRLVARDLQLMLGRLGYDVLATAASAEDAIARVSTRCPDVVLMDIGITGEQDGIEAADILGSRFGVSVIYLTAHSDDATVERARRTGAHGYLLKPVDQAALRSAIEVALYRHAMDQRLRERERWFSTTLRSIADSVITIDLARRVTFMNPAAEALTGRSSSDAIGRPVDEVVRLRATDAPVELPAARALREGRTITSAGAQLVNQENSAIVTIDDHAAPVFDEDRRLLGGVMVSRDVTSQRRLEAQLELSDRLASIGAMAAGVAHEINNPLAAVQSNIDFLLSDVARLRRLAAERDGADGELAGGLERLVDVLADVHAAADRIGRVVSDLRTFTRPARTEMHRADLTRCLQWAIRTTSHELRHRASLETVFTEVPAARADEARLGQVFVNLLLNAAQAIQPGHADTNRVRVAVRWDVPDWIVVEISDTGVGIAPEQMKRIFEPFFTTKPVGGGTGLGLSICHDIVQSLGGEIEVESEPGCGTTFTVRVPPAPDAVADAPAPEAKAVVVRGRIVVIDDDPVVLRALARILRDHEVVCLARASEALELLARDPDFDIIITDVMMPRMTGIELYEQLLQRSPVLAGRVVFLSGGALAPGADTFRRSVPNPWIEKPFVVAHLLALVQDLLSRR